MRTRIAVALFALVAVVAIACTPAAPTVIVNNNLNNTVEIILGQPVPSATAGCPAIGRIQINRPEALTVGEKGKISATPKDPEGKDRAASCDIADGLTWSPNPTDRLSIADPRAFETEVTGGPKTGDVALSVSVGKAAGSVVIRIQ